MWQAHSNADATAQVVFYSEESLSIQVSMSLHVAAGKGDDMLI